MDSLPIFPGLGQQLSTVLHALESELIQEPVWTLKRTSGKIFLDIAWTTAGSKSPAKSKVTKPANCATQLEPVKQVGQMQYINTRIKPSAKPGVERKRKKKSPSTRRRDKQRRVKWLQTKCKSSSEQPHQSSVGPDACKAPEAEIVSTTNSEPALDNIPADSQSKIPPAVSRDEQPLHRGKELVTELSGNELIEKPICKINMCFNLNCHVSESSEVTLKRCSRCNIAKYCSRTCQIAHWRDHRKKCGKTIPTAL